MDPLKILRLRHKHLEMLAAAYLQTTDIPAERAVLVEKRKRCGKTETYEWYFREMTDAEANSAAEREGGE